MIVLLDENFPMGLLRGLHNDGISAEHIITLGWRGASDARIRERLQDARVLFLTQDEDFLFGRGHHCVARQAVALFERSDRDLAKRHQGTPASVEARAALRVDGQRHAPAVAKCIERHVRHVTSRFDV